MNNKKLKRDIRSLSEENLTTFFKENNQPKYRINQLKKWLWQDFVTTFDEMTNFPIEFRNTLKDHFVLHNFSAEKNYVSSDGTIKSVFSLEDKKIIESVMIPTKNRNTACISSQVGCSLDCKFCATGFIKMERNLFDYEMFEQVIKIKKQLEKNDLKLTNIVYMGMGEPLLNYKNVLSSIDKITNQEYGIGFSQKRITVSTSGICKIIRQLGDDNVKFNLAVSLHSCNNETRSKLMSINNTNNLENLRDSIKYYFSKTKNIITYEYVLLKGINDTLEDAKQLHLFTKHILSKVNIIEYNKVKNTPFEKSDIKTTNNFVNYLESKGVVVKLRKSRGEDIYGACGQLGKTNF